MSVNLTVNVVRGNLAKALSIFKKEVRSSEILDDYKLRCYYEKPTTKRRREKKDANFKKKVNLNKS